MVTQHRNAAFLLAEDAEDLTVTPSVLTGAELAVFHIEYHHEACPFIAESIPHHFISMASTRLRVATLTADKIVSPQRQL
jgi:hypothetical protein